MRRASKAAATWLATWAAPLAACTGQIGTPELRGAGAVDGSTQESAALPTPATASVTTSGSNPSSGASQVGGSKLNCADTQAWDVGPTPLRRLTQLEYSLTLQQLLQLPAAPDVSAVPAETAKGGFTVYSEHQTLSAQHLRGYLDVASKLATELLADAKRRTAVLGCELTADDCLPSFIARFGRLAYRRPLSAAEVTMLRDAAQQDATDATDATEPYLFALEALLVSPNFLYRSELGEQPAQAGAPQRLSDYEIASRLSFALLGRGPSAALLDQAGKGALQTADGRAEVADQLATEAGFPALYASFFEQWLGFGKLIHPKQPPADWDNALLDDMRAETRAVLERFAYKGGNLLDVFSGDETVVTPRLATFYRLPTPDKSGLVKIPGDHPRARAGLLGHASLLSKKSDGDAVAQRGNWLRSTFLCQHLEIPAAVAATLGERLVGLTHTQIVRERNTDAACRGCHAVIDPIGVGLDAFDATGRFDPDYKVPDYGVEPAFPDAPEPAFSGVAELSAKLKAMPQLTSCLTARTFLFTHGRDPDERDRCAIQRAEEAFEASGFDFRALVDSLVTSPAFVLRRAPEASALGTAQAQASAQGAKP